MTIKILQKELSNRLFYDGYMLLKYTIHFPYLMADTAKHQDFINSINDFYKVKATDFQRYCISVLFPSAIDEYKFDKENGYPVRAYEAILQYTVTFNNAGMVSLYFDQYEYTAGAHGNTVRTSDTWDIPKEKHVAMKDLFPENPEYKETIIKIIDEQIAAQIAKGTGQYFDNYAELVRQYFDEKNFYMTAKDIMAVYYQQYEIAPYSSGIPVFSIVL